MTSLLCRGGHTEHLFGPLLTVTLENFLGLA
jgi:hypothetical protein